MQRVIHAALLAVGIAIAVNALLILVANANRSWTALGIAIIFGPIMNGILIVVSLAFVPVVRRLGGGASVSLYVLAGILVPIAATVVDAACIMSMKLQGC